MEINSIQRGIVIDHITAGRGTKILRLLGVDTSRDTVAFIMNAASRKYGKKDIIKIENVTDIDLTALGLVDPLATVNIIEDHVIIKKINLEIPQKLVNVIKCKNPRCVTSVETGIPQIFHLIDREEQEYRCEYCDDVVSMKGECENEIILR